jgi:hypothetical protein
MVPVAVFPEPSEKQSIMGVGVNDVREKNVLMSHDDSTPYRNSRSTCEARPISAYFNDLQLLPLCGKVIVVSFEFFQPFS